MSWLDELKVGDQVISNGLILTITAVHKKHIVCGINKFNKTSGRLVGSSVWSHNYIRQATPEALQEIKEQYERRELLTYLDHWRFKNLPTPYLVRLTEIIKEYESELEREES